MQGVVNTDAGNYTIVYSTVHYMTVQWRTTVQYSTVQYSGKEESVMSIPMFSHFKMELIQIFSKPQRRKADEGVRIFHLYHDHRMKNEK